MIFEFEDLGFCESLLLDEEVVVIFRNFSFSKNFLNEKIGFLLKSLRFRDETFLG